MDLAGWREALRRRVRNLYLTMRQLYERSPFLVVATRLGGYHGYDPAGATLPDGRRGHRLRQGVQARAARRAGEGRRLPGQPQDVGAGRRC